MVIFWGPQGHVGDGRTRDRVKVVGNQIYTTGIHKEMAIVKWYRRDHSPRIEIPQASTTIYFSRVNSAGWCIVMAFQISCLLLVLVVITRRSIGSL